MIRVNHRAFRTIWGIVAIFLATGWALWGIAWRTNAGFQAVMVAATIILLGSGILLLRTRPTAT